jgi:hypothetical protein
MSGAETIRRATDAYVAGLITFEAMEKLVEAGLDAERNCTDVEWAFLHLPFPWQIRKALCPQ